MNVLIVDSDGTGLDMAYLAAESGHDVKWWVAHHEDGTPVRDGDGFPGIKKVRNWKNECQWAKSGIIINLYNDKQITRELDRYRALGYPVFGPSVKSAELEWSRAKGMALFQRHGIEVPAYHEFQSLEDALRFAYKATQPFVFKTMGDEEDKSLSYVSSDPADLVAWLETKISHGLKLKGPCILQEKIDMIAEVGIAGWMGKHGFLDAKWNINFEHKKLMPGDNGPNTGEMGTVCRYVPDSKLAEEMLLPFEEDLRKLGHIGDVDVNCGIDSKGRAWPFEWTCRYGWPSTQIVYRCHEGDSIQWMKDAIEGRDTLDVDYRTAIGLVLAMPPFPAKNEDPSASVGYVVTGLDEVWDNISPWQLMIDDGPKMKDGKVTKGKVFKTSGEYVCVVTAKGHDVHDVIPEVYEIVDRIKYCDKIFRNDVGKKLEKTLPKLRALGYEEVPEW